MIRHQAIGRDADPGGVLGLGENLLKRRVVSGLVKQGESPDSAVEDMIGEVSGSKSWTARHGRSYTGSVAIVSRKDSRPLLFP